MRMQLINACGQKLLVEYIVILYTTGGLIIHHPCMLLAAQGQLPDRVRGTVDDAWAANLQTNCVCKMIARCSFACFSPFNYIHNNIMDIQNQCVFILWEGGQIYDACRVSKLADKLCKIAPCLFPKDELNWLVLLIVTFQVVLIFCFIIEVSESWANYDNDRNRSFF